MYHDPQDFYHIWLRRRNAGNQSPLGKDYTHQIAKSKGITAEGKMKIHNAKMDHIFAQCKMPPTVFGFLHPKGP